MTDNSNFAMNVIPHFARLHEYVAIEEGLFEAEGLEVSLQSIETMNQHGMYEKAIKSGTDVGPSVDEVGNAVNSACAWGVACNTGSGTGRFVSEPYIVSEQVFYADPETDVHSLEDLADVPIGVSAQSGTHFGSLRALESVVPADSIEFEFVGTPRQQFRAFIEGDIQAANLMGPYPYMAEQRGYRKLADQTIPVLFYVTSGASEAELTRYFSAMREADERIRAEPVDYKHLWEQVVPDEFQDYRYDFDAFGVGELLRFEPFPRDEFEAVVEFVERWDMDHGMTVKEYDELVMTVGAD